MSAVGDFLAWFDGVTAFMGEAPPKAEQWAKIRARIEELRKAPPDVVSPAALSVVTTEVAAKAVPIDWAKAPKPQWQGAFLETLIKGGFDGETAREILGDKDLDHKSDPVAQANKKIVGLGGTPVAA